MKRLNNASKAHLITAVVTAPLLFFCLATSANAQSAKLNLSRLDKLASKASKTADVSLEGPMLQLAAQSMASNKHHPRHEDQAMQQMLERLKGVYVRAYNFSRPGEYSRADLEGIFKQLDSGGWTSIVKVRKRDQDGREDTVNISVMKEGGEVVGMAIIAAKPTKLAIVNIVGPIDFSQLSSLGDLGGMMGGVGAMAGMAGGLQYRAPAPRPAPRAGARPVPPAPNTVPAVPPAPPQ